MPLIGILPVAPEATAGKSARAGASAGGGWADGEKGAAQQKGPRGAPRGPGVIIQNH
jgi:hypothetical protein